jgi:hypothetical protein
VRLKNRISRRNKALKSSASKVGGEREGGREGGKGGKGTFWQRGDSGGSDGDDDDGSLAAKVKVGRRAGRRKRPSASVWCGRKLCCAVLKTQGEWVKSSEGICDE